MENYINRIQNIAIDATYGKKKHFNAADRKDKMKLWLGLPSMIVNLVVGSLLFGLLDQSSPTFFKWMAAIVSVVTGIMGAIMLFLNIPTQVEGHRRIGNKYLSIVKRCQTLIALMRENESIDIKKEIECLDKDMHQINQDAESYSTAKKDYKAAQEGVQKGEEIYLPKELEVSLHQIGGSNVSPKSSNFGS